MTTAEKSLLLATARILRALISQQATYAEQADDLASMNEALAPFDPSPAQQKVLDMMNGERRS